MSETKANATQGLGAEQVNEVSGGCYTAPEIEQILNGLKGNYESLIDAMSYVFERVSGK